MVTNYSKIPIKLAILLVGFGLLVAGCDSTGPAAEDESDQSLDISYEATGDLGDRITSFEGSSSNTAVLTGGANTAKEAKTISFEATGRVSQPNIAAVSQNVRASHLALSSGKLYVGYKVLGSDYGGGIDILDASSGLSAITSTDADALTVDDVDIQEIAVKNDGSGPTALLAATAVAPAPFQSPPQLHSIELTGSDGLPNGSNVSYEAIELTPPNDASRVVKSVVSGPQSNTYGAFAASDTSIHAIETSSNGQTIDDTTAHTPDGDTQFRSVVETDDNGVFTLTLDGKIFAYNGAAGLGSQLNDFTISTNPNARDTEDGIARLSSHKFPSGDEFLFVSLIDNGFRVVNPDNGSVVFSDSEITATSVTATDDYLFVAGGDGFAVYSIDGSDPTVGVSDLGRASINDIVGGGGASSAQVNHILVDDSGSDIVLYVAKSYDGVYRLKEKDSSLY